MNIRSAINLMLTAIGVGLFFKQPKWASPSSRGEARISGRFRSNQRQRRKDCRRAHAAGKRNAFV